MQDSSSRPVIDRFQALSEDKKKLLAMRLHNAFSQSIAAQDQRLVGFIIADDAVNAEAVTQHIKRTLPQYMLPSQITILDALPRTPNGKLDRSALIKKVSLSSTSLQAGEHVPEIEDDTEKTLADIWRKLLRLESVSPHDNFFELGGHSLLAVRMLAQIKASFGQDIPVSLIVESPTIARLAAHLRASTPQTTSIVTLQAAGDAPPLYLLPLHIHGALHYRHLIALLGQERPLYGMPGFEVIRADGSLPTVEALATTYVDTLLRFQPKGPYYLCGTSIAGLLAYEMGRQLHERGIHDVKVILLDTYGPDYPERLPIHRALSQMIFPAHRPNIPLGTRLKDSGIYWLQRTWAAWKTYRSQRQGLYSEEGDNQDPNYDSAAISKQLAGMTNAYFSRPRPYNGQVILFRAQQQPWTARYDRTLGWQKFVQTPVQVIDVRGEHLSILKRYYAKNLAVLFRRMLGRLDKDRP
jgi:thioesterase domain-containing protein/acyl carrier protein